MTTRCSGPDWPAPNCVNSERRSSVAVSEQVRLRLHLGYDGTECSGWARQPGRRTVQAVLEDGLRTVLRRDDIALTVAGRTDTGVHATGQVAHLDVADALWQEHRDLLLRRL